MKSPLVAVLGILATGMIVASSNVLEKHFPLSKKAKKGYIYSINREGGRIDVTYKVKGDKKKEAAFQVYEFDDQLNLVSTDPRPAQITEVSKPDYTRKVLYSYVGGNNSFTVLSMAIKFARREYKYTWNPDKKHYDRKTITSEDVKLKNEAGKKYQGYADFYNSENGNALALVKLEGKYSLLNVNYDLDIKETPFPFDHPVAPVLACRIPPEGTDADLDIDDKSLESKDRLLFIFSAGTKKGIDWKKYTLFICDLDGRILSRDDFNSPSPNLDIMDVATQGKDIYLFGGSSDDLDALYFSVYGDFTSISGAVAKEAKRAKMAKKGYDFTHILKVTDGKVAYSTTLDLKDYKAKLRLPPGQKSKVSSYNGKNFAMTAHYLAPNGDLFLSGQKTDWETKGFMYEDILCFQFDKDGNLKAQFGIDNLNDDNKSTVFQVGQKFIPSPSDKNVVYLELMEVKGRTGYAGFWDAVDEIKTYYANYYPRIMKLDVSAAAITNVDILGAKKYFINNNSAGSYLTDGNKKIYVGEDEDDKEIWLGSYQFD